MIAAVRKFIQPSSSRSTRFFQLAAVSIIVLVALLYHLSWTATLHGAPREPAAAQRRQQHIEHVILMYNYSVGLVWPRNDVDDDDDRILSQIDVVNFYARQKRKRKLKIILRVGNFNFENWVAGQEQFVRDACPIVDCWMTKDKSQARDADALLISEFSESDRHLYLPKPHRQIWIAQHWESPLHNRIDPKAVRGLINWTASYRHDSTVSFRYGKMVAAAASSTPGGGSVNYAAGKSKLVAWFVSNCRAKNKRMRYAQELSQFIQVRYNDDICKYKCVK